MNEMKQGELGHVGRLQHLLNFGVIKDWFLAIDGGANVGAWSEVMAERFNRVIGFEPTPETFEIYQRNLGAYPNVECRNEALMDKAGTVSMNIPQYLQKYRRKKGQIFNTKLTARYAVWNNHSKIRAVTVDSLELPSCGLIKLDLEGAEPLALKGARRTIKRFHPVLIVEIKRHANRYGFEAEEVHDMVIDMDYHETYRKGRDRFYVAN